MAPYRVLASLALGMLQLLLLGTRARESTVTGLLAEGLLHFPVQPHHLDGGVLSLGVHTPGLISQHSLWSVIRFLMFVALRFVCLEAISRRIAVVNSQVMASCPAATAAQTSGHRHVTASEA